MIDIDLHGMSVQEARRYLERTIMNASKNIRIIHVIHGYHSDKLKQMVRSVARSNKRVERFELSLNPGITDLYIK